VAALHTLAEPAGGRVRFAGPLDDATLEGLWRSTDLFALASEWEGYPAAIAEALRRGIPVAVTAEAAGPALVTPQTGVICESGSPVQLSRSLRRLIYDTGLRAAMADAAWEAGQSLPSWAQQARLFAAATA
jgi:glycosyltransferase involved in cell wall biosynthesis